MRQEIGLARGSYVGVFLQKNSCKNLPIDELDRKTANDMRLRHYSGEITSVNSFTKLAHGTLPVSFAIVQLQT